MKAKRPSSPPSKSEVNQNNKCKRSPFAFEKRLTANAFLRAAKKKTNASNTGTRLAEGAAQAGDGDAFNIKEA